MRCCLFWLNVNWHYEYNAIIFLNLNFFWEAFEVSSMVLQLILACPLHFYGKMITFPFLLVEINSAIVWSPKLHWSKGLVIKINFCFSKSFVWRPQLPHNGKKYLLVILKNPFFLTDFGWEISAKVWVFNFLKILRFLIFIKISER